MFKRRKTFPLHFLFYFFAHHAIKIKTNVCFEDLCRLMRKTLKVSLKKFESFLKQFVKIFNNLKNISPLLSSNNKYYKQFKNQFLEAKLIYLILFAEIFNEFH
mgnify:CR=1 FL=1